MRPHSSLIADLVTMLVLAGCATTATDTGAVHGNFIPDAPVAHEKQLADDAVRQLQLLYPPAGTRLDLRQAPVDGFGRQLVELLRGQGYALQESAPLPGMPASAGVSSPTPAAGAAGGIAFNYVLDAMTSPKLYRVTLLIGDQSITRAYIPQSDAIYPAGAWVRKE